MAEKPILVSASAGSINAATVLFAPTPGATTCTVIETPVNGKTSVETVIHHLSYPVTVTHPVGLSADTVYTMAVTCVVDDKSVSSSKTKPLHTPKSDAHPEIVNLHPTSALSGSFDIMKPNSTTCDVSQYNVFAKPTSGPVETLTLDSTHVDLNNLQSAMRYEITVDALCKDGSTLKSAPAFLTIPSVPPPPPPSLSSPSRSPPLSLAVPKFHLINVFGPHPTIGVSVDNTAPDGSIVNVNVTCDDGSTFSVSHAASKPETLLQIPSVLPTDTNCTFSAKVLKGSVMSPGASTAVSMPKRIAEAPRLENWRPNYNNQSAQVTVVAPKTPICNITSYVVSSTVPSSATAQAPGPITIINIQYASKYNISVVGVCEDGSKTPEGHLAVSTVNPLPLHPHHLHLLVAQSLDV